MPAELHFLRPYWLLAMLPLLVLVGLMVQARIGSRSWEMVCDAALLPHVLTGARARRRRLSVILTAIGGLLSILALAGPVWERLPQPVFTRTSSLVLALDLSRSMDAADVSPSRLLRARYKVADILKARTEGQTALLVYAGDSFTVTPLTDDTATINAQLGALTTDIMPVPGSDTSRALNLAEQLLKQAGVTRGDILLVTDEIDGAAAGEAAARLRTQGYRVSVLGVGTEEGAPITRAQGDFLKDSSGRIVIPKLVDAPLRKVAGAGGGIYVRITPGNQDTAQLLDFFAGRGEQGRIESTELRADTWREQGPWLLLGVLPLMALLFRRGYLVVLLLFLQPVPQPAQALEWGDLWLRPDQRAQRAFNEGDTAAAAQLFRDPAWKGSAQYKSGDFAGAASSLEPLPDAESQYNRGNALARMGNYAEAIAAYEQALSQEPGHADARYNKALVERELQQQNQQQQQQQQKQQAGEPEQNSRQDQEQGGDPGQQQADTDQQRSEAGPQADLQPRDEPGQQQDRRQPDQEQPAADQGQPREQTPRLAQSDQKPPDEDQQATEQWLRRIPDDPAGLLRRKFLYQYQQRGGVQAGEKNW
jgi:Ca-activated chloride channel family protein